MGLSARPGASALTQFHLHGVQLSGAAAETTDAVARGAAVQTLWSATGIRHHTGRRPPRRVGTRPSCAARLAIGGTRTFVFVATAAYFERAWREIWSREQVALTFAGSADRTGRGAFADRLRIGRLS